MTSRPPNVQSRSALFSVDLEAPTYAHLSDAEIDRLIIKCRWAIACHRQDGLSSIVDTAETALVAIDGVKAILHYVLDIAPTEQLAKIKLLIEQGE